ncbi:hypothetical protein [Rodentibacter myodis]|uniref:Uncharacterized protein n=1 Tax=Rodentibacter myodis TaxID=1907939 RepID=A0A1V3JJF0_9PAST|nr:hypothetical protein [Rodentibacter myodis]OOF56432.1 hypothetical protein BKL49_10630 [Rodentibacter myodis]
MLEQSSKFLAVLLSLVSVGIILAIDLFMFLLQSPSQAIPHLSFGVLTAQLITLLVFYKGEICPGQRGRLIQANLPFALYWAVGLILSLLPNSHNTLANVMSVCGLSVVYFIWKQPKQEKLRNSFLLMAALVAGLGMLSYFMALSLLPFSTFAQYNPVALILLGVVLANLMLVIARSRLQGFIALLPLAMIVLLALNALTIFIFLCLNGLESAVNFESVLAYGIYFLCHFAIAAILMAHSFQKWTLNANTLFILLFITACLPLWLEFI